MPYVRLVSIWRHWGGISIQSCLFIRHACRRPRCLATDNHDTLITAKNIYIKNVFEVDLPATRSQTENGWGWRIHPVVVSYPHCSRQVLVLQQHRRYTARKCQFWLGSVLSIREIAYDKVHGTSVSDHFRNNIVRPRLCRIHCEMTSNGARRRPSCSPKCPEQETRLD